MCGACLLCQPDCAQRGDSTDALRQRGSACTASTGVSSGHKVGTLEDWMGQRTVQPTRNAAADRCHAGLPGSMEGRTQQTARQKASASSSRAPRTTGRMIFR